MTVIELGSDEFPMKLTSNRLDIDELESYTILSDSDSESSTYKRANQENIQTDTLSTKMQQMNLNFAVLCFLLPTSFAFLAHNIFETGDPRLFPLFCVDSSEQLATLATNTSTQQMVIKDAVKNSVGRFLAERHHRPLPPQPQKLSLSELYQMYLGDCASPDRFILAVNELVDNAAKLDILPGLKDNPKFHFDAESILEAQATLVERQGLLVTTITTESKFSAARHLLGRSLHSLTTFYAHTNWVELGNTEPLAGLGVPGGQLPQLASDASPACNGSNIIASGLTSGYLPDQPDSATRCRHGSRKDTPGSGGINKDTGSECWSQHAHHHQEAARQATLAVEGYLDHLRFVLMITITLVVVKAPWAISCSKLPTSGSSLATTTSATSLNSLRALHWSSRLTGQEAWVRRSKQ